MREIKFSGIRNAELDPNKGEWIVGDLMQWKHDGNKAIMPQDKQTGYVIDPSTVGQFTGLRDKNGKEIYEGDIVKLPCDEGQVYEVRNDFYEYAFDSECPLETFTGFFLVAHPKHDVIPFGSALYEVIGNIHEHPELLI